jgi:GxxExxY protein
MNTDLLEADLTRCIIGAGFEVLKGIGHGLHEKPYENALVVELGLQRVLCEQQRRYPIFYKNVQVAEFIPDLVVASTVIVDAKVIERITDLERGQMLNYLRISGLRVGLILNFKRPKLEWERLVL